VSSPSTTRAHAGSTKIAVALRSGHHHRALELLLQDCQDGIFAYCARLVSINDALAVYNQVLVVATEELAQIDSKYPRAWLYQIAREVVLHHHHKVGVAGNADASYLPVSAPLEEPRTKVARAFAQLAPNMREVLQLALWHGLRMSEIASIVGLPVQEVRRLSVKGLLAVAILSRDGAPS